jgi:hypothetical protein
LLVPALARRQRPLGVTILTILQIIGGIGDIILGVLLLLAYAVVSALIGGGFLGTALLLLGMVAFGLGIFSFALAYGLWTGKGWAWIFSLIGALIGLMLGVVGRVVGGLTLENLANLIPIVLYALILFYLNTGNVRAFFGRSAGVAIVRPVVPAAGGPPYVPLTQTQYPQPSVPPPYYPPQQATFPQPAVQQPYYPQPTPLEIGFCRNCGTPAQPGANFCDCCGARLR